MKLTVLGTGHATVKNIYNTCFVMENQQEYLLVDAGGGNRILKQLELANISLNDIHHMFVTHKHTDHILGVVWIVRMISTKILNGQYKGTLTIYCHEELIETIKTLCTLTLQKKLTDLFDKQILFVGLEDGDQHSLLNCSFTFFDILSTKAKQFGFVCEYEGEKIAFCGDEPFNETCLHYVKDCTWLLHEAFCLYRDKDIYKPYEKHHSTAKDAGHLANLLHTKNLILWHSEEDTQDNKKELYTKEASEKFKGNIYVPSDLDIIKITRT